MAVKYLNDIEVDGDITADNLSGANTGDQTNISGTAGVATTVTLADYSGYDTCYPVFSQTAAGDHAMNTDTSILTYVPGTGTLTSTTFVGALNGNASTATTAATVNAVTISANNSTDETVYLIFVDGATDTQGLESDTGLTYNPSSGMLTSTSFAGALIGNATTATALTAGNKTLDGNLTIGSDQAGHDLILYGATQYAQLQWDASMDFLKVSDQAKIVFGSGGNPTDFDSSIQANGSNLVIYNDTGNVQIGDTVEITGDLQISEGLILDSVDITRIQTSGESFVDDDTSLMTSAAIDDRIAAGGGGGTPTDITVEVEASDTTCYPLFVTNTTGDLEPKTHGTFSYNSASRDLSIGGKLTVTGNEIKDDDGISCITFDSTGNTSIANDLEVEDAIVIESHVGSPGVTTNTLYNNAGELNWDGGVIAKTKVVSLTAAQYQALGTTAFQIIPAPGASQHIILHSVFIKAVNGSTVETSADTLYIGYETSSSKYWGLHKDFLRNMPTSTTWVRQIKNDGDDLSDTSTADRPMSLYSASDNAGDVALDVVVNYSIIRI